MKTQNTYIQNNQSQNNIGCNFIKDFSRSCAEELRLQNHYHSVLFPCTAITRTGSALIALWIVPTQQITTNNTNNYMQNSNALPDNTPSLQSWHPLCWEFSPCRAGVYLADPPPGTAQGRGGPGERTGAFWREHKEQSVRHLLTSQPKPAQHPDIYTLTLTLLSPSPHQNNVLLIMPWATVTSRTASSAVPWEGEGNVCTAPTPTPFSRKESWLQLQLPHAWCRSQILTEQRNSENPLLPRRENTIFIHKRIISPNSQPQTK